MNKQIVVEVGQKVEISYYANCCNCGYEQGFTPKAQEKLLKKDSPEYIRAVMGGDSNPEGYTLVHPCKKCNGRMFEYFVD